MSPELLTVQNSSYEKFDDKGGVKTEPMTRWKKRLSPQEIALIEYVCGSTLADAGYEVTAPKVSRLSIYRGLATTTPAVLSALKANSGRSGNIFKYVARRARLAFK